MVDQWTPDGRFVIVHERMAKRCTPCRSAAIGRRACSRIRRSRKTKSTSRRTAGGWRSMPTSRDAGRCTSRHFPAFTSKRQISNAGGVQPQWRADGRELFYLHPDGSMMSVRVETRHGSHSRPAGEAVPDPIVAGPRPAAVRCHRRRPAFSRARASRGSRELHIRSELVALNGFRCFEHGAVIGMAARCATDRSAG